MTNYKKVKKILVFRIGHLGDTLIALPAFWQLRKSFPDAEITLLSNTDIKNPHYLSATSVLPESGLFDSFLAYPTGITGFRRGIELLKLLITIRANNYDLVLYLMTRNRTLDQIKRDKQFFAAAGVSELKGFSYLQENRLAENPTFGAAPVVNESAFLKELLFSAGVVEHAYSDSPDCTELLLTDAEKHYAADLITKAKIESKLTGASLIAVAPGSKWESKKWAKERFVETLQNLSFRVKILPLIFGGKEDISVGDDILHSLGFGSNLAGRLNIRQSAAALAHCSIYIGNDTGTMHLAAAVGTPCVAIFSAIDWVGRWNPIGAGHEVIRKRVECEGCHSPVCVTDRRCLDQISVQEVTDSAFRILEKT